MPKNNPEWCKLSIFVYKKLSVNLLISLNMISKLSKIAVIALFFASCDNMTISTGDGSKKITGNGKTVSELREIKSFNAISIDGVFNVILEQGSKESAKVETDENILPVIITVVENDTLKVKMKDSTSVHKMTKLDVFITLVSISSIKTVGVGSLKSTNTLHLKDLDLNFEGVGATEINLEADKLTVESKTVGALLLSGLVKETTINHNGVGIIHAFDLKSEKLILHTSGVGAAEVFASQELTIDASGIGGVEYKGGATIKEIKNDGIGKVVCMDCK